MQHTTLPQTSSLEGEEGRVTKKNGRELRAKALKQRGRKRQKRGIED